MQRLFHIFIQSGFLGHSTDARQYRLIAPVGPGRQLSLPENCFILADKIYPSKRPLLTAWKANDIRPIREQRKFFNIEHAHYRVHVEHVIRAIKQYRILQERWRHPREHLPKVADICGCLANRHIRLITAIR